MRLNKRKIARKLAKIGSMVDTSYMVYVNNDEPCMFPSQSDALSYIKEYRESNQIFRLQIYRIETYSL